MLRKRARKACIPCHKRKVKCNGDFPCDICKGYGYDCEYATDSEKHPAKRAQIETTKTTTTLTDASAVGHASTNHTPNLTRAGSNEVDDGNTPAKSYMLVEVPNRKPLKLSSDPFPESFISRYTTAYSAVAFPRDLGKCLGLSDPPRLQSLAWHTGTREERLPPLGNRLFNQISLQDALKYYSIYFEIIHPVFPVLDQALATQACINGWNLKQMPIDVEATICGLIALGSLFSASATPWEMEASVVQQARHLLEISVSDPLAQLCHKFVIAWILRALYLRCTTRAHLSWMAICNAMHIAEAVGVHQQFRDMDALQQRSQETIWKETVHRRRTFWVAMSLNRLFSMEHGRSSVIVDHISCSRPTREDGSGSLVDFLDLCEHLPSFSSDSMQVANEKESLVLNLERLAELDPRNPPLGLLKAEICFILFRRMRFLRMALTESQIGTVLNIIQAALLESQSLSNSGSKWWNIASVPFQSVCVLIAMDTSTSLALLSNAMDTLGIIARAYDTHSVREALEIAAQLVRALRRKKTDEVHVLDKALDISSVNEAGIDTELDIQETHELPFCFDWPVAYDGGWMEILANTDIAPVAPTFDKASFDL